MVRGIHRELSVTESDTSALGRFSRAQKVNPIETICTFAISMDVLWTHVLPLLL